MTEAADTRIDVVVCTYRRPELLARTLEGIARCGAGMRGIHVIIIDNDVRRSAYLVVEEWATRTAMTLDYLVQPVQNISMSRNLGLERAAAPWVAFIDDDEVPGAGWLPSLLAAADRYDADVVFAPVISEFDSGAPAWATQGTLFQRKRFQTGTVVPQREMRTGNVLIRRRRLAQDGFRFDPELGLSGGEDSAFFARLVEAGYRTVWCDEAWVHEWTPRSRTTLSWVLKRAFRIGSVEAYNKRRLRRVRETGVATLKCSIFVVHGGLAGLLWSPISTSRSIQSMFRAALGAGFFYGLLVGPYREYRRSPDTPTGDTR